MSKKTIQILIASFIMALTAILPACGQNIFTPEDPSGPAEFIPEHALVRNAATQVSLHRYVGLATAPQDYSCLLTCEDTVTVHIPAPSFSYERGLGSAFPSGSSVLDLRLYGVGEQEDVLVSSLPFAVDGGTMETFIIPGDARTDSVKVVLPPGLYRLEYGGFSRRHLIGAVPASSLSSDASPSNVAVPMCGSHVTLRLECIPLIPVPRHDPVSWNRVSVLTSRDGSSSPSMMMETVTWLDDFGREESVHEVAASPSFGTVASLVEHDAYGEVSRRWLPSVMAFSPSDTTRSDRHVSPSALRSGAVTSAGDACPYAETVRDGSPLGRTVAEWGPGLSWRAAGRAESFRYLSNSSAVPERTCLIVEVAASLDSLSASVSCTGRYEDGTLGVREHTDEDGRRVLTFVDRFGREVLSRQVVVQGASVSYLDTYSVHDGLGNLVAVLPPALSSLMEPGSTLPRQEVDRYAYLLMYDRRNRPCASKRPGCGWVCTVYDDADRAVFVQDAVQRQNGECTFHVHDVHGRKCVTGICERPVAPGESLPGIAVAVYEGASGPLDGYSVTGVTLDSPQVTAAFYYDSYDFMSDFQTGLPGGSPMYGPDIRRTVGLPTGSGMHVVTGSVSQETVWSAVMYDSMGRVSRKETSFPDGVTDTEDSGYDFLGSPVHRHLEHSYPSQETPGGLSVLTEDIRCKYDHAERLTEMTHSLDGGVPVLLMRNTYDELGRLSGTQRGGSDDLSTTYTYNVRSWLTGLSGPLFSETLHYEDLRHPSLPSSMRRYGGGVSSMEWRASGDSGTRSYDYSYDGLGRLVSASYGENGSHVSGYGTSYSYDIMGNVLSLSREGDLSPFSKGIVDDLSMAYDGNRLLSVSDTAQDSSVAGSMDFRDGVSAGVEYSYDRNGAMTSDLNRGITGISYNRAGRPARIEYAGGVETFSYLADGTKLARTVSRDGEPPSVTEYRGNLVYEGGSLKYVLVDGGMVSMEGGSPEYVFFLVDHLGSTRVAATEDGGVHQVNHYYPFGASYASSRMATDSVPGVDAVMSASQPYRFLGNEFLVDAGVDIYDFHARMYDPVLGRFLSVDPLAEKYYSVSPYAYCAGNPVRYVDPEGETPWWAIAALLEYGNQVYENYKKGYEGADAWLNNIDFFDVAVSGFSVFGKTSLLKSVTTEGLKAFVDLKVAREHENEERTTIGELIANVIADLSIGKFVDFGSSTNLAQSLDRMFKSSKLAGHLRRVSDNRPASTVRSANAIMAEAEAEMASSEYLLRRSANFIIRGNETAADILYKALYNFLKDGQKTE